MLELAPYRIVAGERQDLTLGAGGWACFEGDTIYIDTRTKNLPVMRVAGAELPAGGLKNDSEGFSARFEIPIMTWAGRTLIEARDGEKIVTTTLEIDPHQQKLGANEFDKMLAELSERSQGLVWGLSPGAAKGMISMSTLAIVHPAVITSQLPVFERLLERYVAAPPMVTLRVRDAFPLNFSRRADLITLRWLGRRPAVLKAVTGDKDVGAFMDARTPIDQPSAVLSTDHPITRYFAYVLRRLRRRFKESVDVLRQTRGRPFLDPTIEAHAEMLAATIEAAARRLDALLVLPLFKQITPEPIGETTLQALSDHPLYAAIYRAARKLLEPGLAYDPGGDLQSSLKHTYDLFELFVLYRIVDGLPGLLGPGWSVGKAKALPYIGREERLPDRAAWGFSGPDGFRLELRYQQWFSRARIPPDLRMFSSLSGVFIPDYIIVLRKDGKPVSWIILDAKYRSGGQAIDQGLADIHRYRDALRIRGLPANGAFIIVPALQDGNAPYVTPEYVENHSFGVLPITSTNWLKTAVNFLHISSISKS
ncbi:hypothetical protein K9U39_14315 [Rhodoblastus acidophilus]|nr:hypothetical protein [Rhodoblastus acidophilus]